MRIFGIFCAIAVLVLAASCAPAVISRGALEGASKVPFRDVSKDPDNYAGRNFVWGGTVVRTSPAGGGSEVEVVQNPIDDRGYITNPDVSGGRFIVVSKNFLDPSIYAPGLSITVAGRLRGGRAGALGGAEYVFPVIEARELYLFKPSERGVFYPSISIGIGIGGEF